VAEAVGGTNEDPGTVDQGVYVQTLTALGEKMLVFNLDWDEKFARQ
jgi:hypothetical protein